MRWERFRCGSLRAGDVDDAGAFQHADGEEEDGGDEGWACGSEVDC